MPPPRGGRIRRDFSSALGGSPQECSRRWTPQCSLVVSLARCSLTSYVEGDMTQPRAMSVAVLLTAALVGGCGGEDREPSRSGPVTSDPGPVHVHGLGVNPRDGALFIATHTGLFRAPVGRTQPKRVGDRFQDTMGFAVLGPDRFLGSGHPDGRDNLPPFLGLIASHDAGKSWKPVSMLGKVDFHVLETAGQTVYGFGSDWDTRNPVFMASTNGGRSWTELVAPEPLIDLAIDPADSRHLVASGEGGLYRSRDGGRGWRPLTMREAGMLVWTRPDRLFRVDRDGRVKLSADGAQSWDEVGSIDGQPAAFDRGAPGQLLAALHDGTVKQSSDDGRTWSVRALPGEPVTGDG